MKTCELSPGKFDKVKSFYGKARIIEKDSGDKSRWDSLEINV